jgi:rod shape-determining protein MreC
MRQLTRRQRMSAAVLAVIALCFITLDLGGGGLRGAHDGVRGTFGSLYRGTDAVLGPVRRWVGGLPDAGTNESRIKALQHDNAVLQGRIDALSSDRSTTAQLARLQEVADGTKRRILPARVMAYGPGGGFDWTVTVDVGSQDGAQTGQSVTNGAGLVGRVLRADAHSAVVLLAADPQSGVGVRDTATGQIGVATGHGAAGFTFAPLDPTAHVHVGDRLVTGPTGSTSFVPGLSVGTVTALHTSSDGTTDATVRPAASPTAVDLVGLVLDTTVSQAASDPLVPRGGR